MLAAERVAEAEEHSAIDGERKEDEQDHRCAEGDLSITASAGVVFPVVGFV